MRRLALCIAIIVLGLGQAAAHYLWLETPARGKLGQAQEIRVYFGEYTYGLRESLEGEAFAAVARFELELTAADGTVIPLDVKPAAGYYVASYTPRLPGQYKVVLVNNDIDVIDYTAYDFGIFKTHYWSVAHFTVGRVEAESSRLNNSDGLSISWLGSVEAEEVQLEIRFRAKPLVAQEVTVFLADQWSKTLETDEAGQVRFARPFATQYLTEVVFTEEVPGTFKGEDYEFIWHCATLSLPQK